MPIKILLAPQGNDARTLHDLDNSDLEAYPDVEHVSQTYDWAFIVYFLEVFSIECEVPKTRHTSHMSNDIRLNYIYIYIYTSEIH